jgi:hypothetical protein
MAREHFRAAHGLGLGFIGIDTIAAVTGWDNDATQTQIVMNHLADVSAATDTFVLAVDPFGRDATKESAAPIIPEFGRCPCSALSTIPDYLRSQTNLPPWPWYAGPVTA